MSDNFEQKSRDRKVVKPSISVSPLAPYTGEIKVSGFIKPHRDAVVVLVISQIGIEELTFTNGFGGNPDTARNRRIVEPTRDINYLVRNTQDKRLPELRRTRAAAIQTAILAADAAFTMVGERLHHDGEDFRRVISDATKVAKTAFRVEHPLDVYSDVDKTKKKAQRRKLKKAVVMTDAQLEAALHVAVAGPLASRNAYREYAEGPEGIAAADAAAVIPPYVVRGGPRADRDQIISGLFPLDDLESTHDRIVRSLMVSRQPADAALAANRY